MLERIVLKKNADFRLAFRAVLNGVKNVNKQICIWEISDFFI